MTDRRKRPLWLWIAATVIALPVLYAASFGPACWLASTLDSPSLWTAGEIVYRPLVLICGKSETTSGYLFRHGSQWQPRRRGIMLPLGFVLECKAMEP
jgi:hypothetical protein